MQITIVVDDKKVVCDGVAVTMPDIDWAVFDGDPKTPWDDVACVQYNTKTGQGHIEYRTIVTAGHARPNIRPGDKPIDAAEFERVYGWIIPAYVEAREKAKAAEKAEMEAKLKATSEASDKALAEYRAAKRAKVLRDGVEVEAAAADDVEALKAKIADLESKSAALENQVSSHHAAFKKLDEITGDGT